MLIEKNFLKKMLLIVMQAQELAFVETFSNLLCFVHNFHLIF